MPRCPGGRCSAGIQHKLLNLHQIRYHVDLAPYDWTWNVIAVLLLAAGVALLVRERVRA